MNDHLFDNRLLELRWRWLWARCETGLDAYPPIARAWLDLRYSQLRLKALNWLLEHKVDRTNRRLRELQAARAKSRIVYPPLARFARRPL